MDYIKQLERCRADRTASILITFPNISIRRANPHQKQRKAK